MDKRLRVFFWTIPILLALVIYLELIIANLTRPANQQEQFSFILFAFDIFKIYIYWFTAQTLIKKFNISLVVFIISSLLIGFLNAGFDSFAKQMMIIYTPQDDVLKWDYIRYYFSEGVVQGVVISSFGFMFQYFVQIKNLEAQQAEIEKEASKAQLHALQTQIHPHFLFNNLNTLQSLIEPENDSAHEFLASLASVYRSILNFRSTDLIPLEEEIKIVTEYSNLVQSRFGDCFTMDIQIKDDNYSIPPFTLLTLVENVIKHNRIDEEHPVNCQVIQKKDEIIVINNLQEKNSSYYSNGIGLENINIRYELIGNKRIDIQKSENEFIIKAPLFTIKEYA
ncbi:sensor histidine kinase [Aureibacter tunicatorum]|uniref:Sensor histidine kinase YesM n=1 Tax=Aureibacter tunicatorum TaxID=866807 RepID=A0AAE4BRS6_9BACT|nr:histidine kinase [Aureibacter tunicatorum]MDR6240504.1 sensor histidine kinase YesM [Aureibacter tunicatorum]BDD06633.1 histidine kinase [Aureibacter tunicatorum]